MDAACRASTEFDSLHFNEQIEVNIKRVRRQGTTQKSFMAICKISKLTSAHQTRIKAVLAAEKVQGAPSDQTSKETAQKSHSPMHRVHGAL